MTLPRFFLYLWLVNDKEDERGMRVVTLPRLFLYLWLVNDDEDEREVSVVTLLRPLLKPKHVQPQ